MIEKLSVEGIEKQVAMEEEEDRVLSRFGRESQEQGLWWRCCIGSMPLRAGYCEDSNGELT